MRAREGASASGWSSPDRAGSGRSRALMGLSAAPTRYPPGGAGPQTHHRSRPVGWSFVLFAATAPPPPRGSPPSAGVDWRSGKRTTPAVRGLPVGLGEDSDWRL